MQEIKELQADFSRANEAIRPVLQTLDSLSQHADCSVALEPLSALRTELILFAMKPFDALRAAVHQTYDLVADFRELKQLGEAEIAFKDRVSWIKAELRYIGSLGEERKQLQEQLESWRQYFKEDQYGIPRYMNLSYDRKLELGHAAEAISNLHQLGGMLTFFKHDILHHRWNATDVAITLGRLRSMTLAHPGPLSVPNSYLTMTARYAESLNNMVPILQRETTYFSKDARAAIHTSMEQLSAGYNQLYRELYSLAGLAPLPSHIEVLEFSAHTTGFSDTLIGAVNQISCGLVIDQGLLIPQEGFGRSIPEKEIRHILSHKNARLFGLQSPVGLVGFHTLLPERDSLPLTLQDAFEFVEHKDLVPSRARKGGCEILGISRSARKELAKQQLSAATIMHQAMIESARAEQLEVLIAVCRSGAQANTAALNSHLRHGWNVVGEIDRNGTPYSVIVCMPDSQFRSRVQNDYAKSDLMLQELREGALPRPKVLRSRHQRTLFEQGLSDDENELRFASEAREISASEALQCLQTFFGHTVDEVQIMNCSDHLCVMIYGHGGSMYALRQLHRGRDRWLYDGDSPKVFGTLDEVAGYLLKKRLHGYS